MLQVNRSGHHAVSVYANLKFSSYLLGKYKDVCVAMHVKCQREGQTHHQMVCLSAGVFDFGVGGSSVVNSRQLGLKLCRLRSHVPLNNTTLTMEK